MNDTMKFPESFVWGVATSSYQIEGAHDQGGRSPSIWDTFSYTEGKVLSGHTGDRACEHYERYADDIRLLSQLGIQHYRFSVSWSRIFPQRGMLNEQGLAFYQALLDECRAYGIKPLMTIYHWDLPQWLQDEGGWVNRLSIDCFLEYAQVLFARFGEEVPMWNTLNEPWCAAILGYGVGVHAPGHTDWREAMIASHHLLVAHGLTIRLYRELGLSGQIGITLNLDHNESATEDSADQEARSRHDGYLNRWFLDPLFKGDYPKDMKAWYIPRIGKLDFIAAGDMEVIGEPGDFLGINYYTRAIVREGNSHPFLRTDQVMPEGCIVTDMGWEVHPESLYKLLCRIQDEYTDLPLYITENGAAQDDYLIDGKVADSARISYLSSHLEQAHRFIKRGGRLQGYYLWSFLDNFEWAFGYEKRFGMVYVDFETLVRTPKQSAYWYQDIVQSGVLPAILKEG
jgi:beta-glucosidase